MGRTLAAGIAAGVEPARGMNGGSAVTATMIPATTWPSTGAATWVWCVTPSAGAAAVVEPASGGALGRTLAAGIAAGVDPARGMHGGSAVTATMVLAATWPSAGAAAVVEPASGGALGRHSMRT